MVTAKSVDDMIINPILRYLKIRIDKMGDTNSLHNFLKKGILNTDKLKLGCYYYGVINNFPFNRFGRVT